MKTSTLIIFISLLITSVAFIIVGLCLNNKNEEPTETNKATKSLETKETMKVNEKLISDMETNGLKISELSFSKVSNLYVYNYKLENESSNINDQKYVVFTFYDQNNVELGKLVNQVNPPKIGESIYCEIRTYDKHIFDATNVKVDIKDFIEE